jgi:aspartate kinase
MVVHKFGGALARSRKGLEALVRIVREVSKREATRTRRSGGDHGLVLVASAIGHTTRHLARAAELAQDSHLREAEEAIDRIIVQHEQLAMGLRLSHEERLVERFEEIANEVRGLLEGIAIVRELSPRTRDAVLACGERFATALIEALLKEHDVAVRFVDARKVILTDEQYGHAAPMLDETIERVHRYVTPHLHRGEVVLTQGFGGATRDGITTTMGSESSDLTATLLGAALEAEEVVIWKVVPGIFSADPEQVPKARLVRTMSFDEAEEAGRRGARVLFQNFAHPITTREARTRIRIATPFGTARQTVLERETPSTRGQKPLLAVLEQGLVPLTLLQRNGAETNRAARRTTKFSAEEIFSRSIAAWQAAESRTLVVRKEERKDAMTELARVGWRAEEMQAVCAVSLVVRKQSGAPLDANFIAQVAKSLRTFHVHALLPAGRSVIAIVDEAEGLAALRKLHHDLFEG